MDQNDLAQDPNAVEVTSPETHFQVQCSEVRLVSSLIKPLESVDAEKERSRFIFKIDGRVEDNTAYSLLEVQVISVDADTEVGIPAYELRFILLGVFEAEEGIQPEALADFVRLYTLSILWPYAREYTSDQLRRVGQAVSALPIINPQVVTELLRAKLG